MRHPTLENQSPNVDVTDLDINVGRAQNIIKNLANAKQYDQALDFFERWKGFPPEKWQKRSRKPEADDVPTNLCVLLASIYLNISKVDEMLDFLEIAAKQSPGDITFIFRFLELLNRPGQSKEQLERMRSLVSKYIEGQLRLPIEKQPQQRIHDCDLLIRRIEGKLKVLNIE